MEEYAVNLVWAYIEYAKGRKLPYWISARVFQDFQKVIFWWQKNASASCSIRLGMQKRF
ncbi:unnamed protein product [Brassica oleracea]